MANTLTEARSSLNKLFIFPQNESNLPSINRVFFSEIVKLGLKNAKSEMFVPPIPDNVANNDLARLRALWPIGDKATFSSKPVNLLEVEAQVMNALELVQSTLGQSAVEILLETISDPTQDRLRFIKPEDKPNREITYRAAYHLDSVIGLIQSLDYTLRHSTEFDIDDFTILVSNLMQVIGRRLIDLKLVTNENQPPLIDLDLDIV